MAKNSTGQRGRGSQQSRRKQVIDLPAEDVKATEGEAASSRPAAEEQEDAEKAGETRAKSSGDRSERNVQGGSANEARHHSTGSSSSESGGGDEHPPTPSAFAERAGAKSAAETHSVERSMPFLTGMLAAAVIGGAAVALVVVALAFAGFFRPVEEESPDLASEIGGLQRQIDALQSETADLRDASQEDALSPLREQLAALEQTVGELQEAPAAPDATTLQEMRDRLAQLEESVALAADGGPPGEPGEQLAARVSQLADELATLRDAPPPDLSGLESALQELRREIDSLSTQMQSLPDEARVAEIETRLDEINRQMGLATAVAPAVAAGALASALEAGRPFASELAALQALGVDAEAVAALQPHAEAGLPTLAELRSQFEDEIADIELDPVISEDAGPLDRLMESARGLVEVRPASPTAGDDPGAIVTRMRAALESGDLKTALAEWETLPQGIRTATAEWAEAARTRMAAGDLAARLRADALARLASEEG